MAALPGRLEFRSTREDDARHEMDPAILLLPLLSGHEEVGLLVTVHRDKQGDACTTVRISVDAGETLGPLTFPSKVAALNFCQMAVAAARIRDAGAVVVLDLDSDL
jgi:hypothetical protein